jgi:GT2 family glycosyltransferase
MPLAVIVLNWNAAEDTINCLRSIRAWDDLAVRVWVVDNASQDGSTARIRKEFQDFRLIESDRNHGFSGGNNLALAEVLRSECQEVLLLNNDATIPAADVQMLLESLRSDRSLGIIGPTIWDSQPPHALLSAGGKDLARNLVSHIRETSSSNGLRLVEYVPGVCVILRVEMLDKVGLLDEDYFFGGELADLCLRARTKGYASAIDERARAYHRVERSSELRQDLHIYYVLRNRFLFMKKFYGRKRWLFEARWVGYGVYLAALAAARGQRQRARSVLLGVADGLRGRFGGQNERVLGRGSVA